MEKDNIPSNKTEYQEGKSAADKFREATRKVLSVPKNEILKMEKADKPKKKKMG